MAHRDAKTVRRPAAFALEGRRRRSVLSMAPLIDFTFILLIFFMVVTQFNRFTPVDISVRKTPLKTMTLPPALPASAKGAKKLRLPIHADGVILLDGEEIGTLESFTGVLAHHQGHGDKDDAPLLMVDPDDDVSVQLLIDVMNALKVLPGFRVQIVMHETGQAGERTQEPHLEPPAGQEIRQ